MYVQPQQMHVPTAPAASADPLPLHFCCCRAHYGPRWKRPPSAQLTKSMRDKLNGYRGNLMQARTGTGFVCGVVCTCSGSLLLHGWFFAC